MMYNEYDDLVVDTLEVLADLGVKTVDDAPYEVLPTISDEFLTYEGLNDFADRIYG